ncbi:GtrA family protein [Pseudaminobacter soli (ex Li et al. 2025)]|uniref:GtrA family protein n=1 Tax=Pseudaminobacter soli (ex Li et al. 2025) TaxID=1295366 RepID=A0A2P7SI91_9HYPH|nr:GtrA family protein [Mesorhizobium soli]PSJ62198.1 GtrA family protein [Mesorhizobium soli]
MAGLLRLAFRQRLVRFVTVGVGAAALLLVLAYLFMSVGLPPFAAGLVAYGGAFLAAYTAQRCWTFGAAHGHGHALPRYFVLQAGCALASGGLAHIAIDLLGMAPLTTSVLITIVTSAVSYVVSSCWVFPNEAA